MIGLIAFIAGTTFALGTTSPPPPPPPPPPTIQASSGADCATDDTIEACGKSGTIDANTSGSVTHKSGGQTTSTGPGAYSGDTGFEARCYAAAIAVAVDGSQFQFARPSDVAQTFACANRGAVAPTPYRSLNVYVTAHTRRFIPRSTIGLAPHGTTLVNIQTVMWVDAKSSQHIKPANLRGKNIDITITLDHVSWKFGDGTTDPNGPAGTRYNQTNNPCTTRLCPGYYGHIYKTRGKVVVEATASWRARFQVDGGPVVNIPGAIDGPMAHADLAVKEARAVLIPNPPGR